MAKEVDFKEGDRIKVITGNLKGNKGYVRYVGKMPGKTDTYIGAELDDAVGKHDGTVKGKKYFKCRDRYGYMAPMSTFALFGKSKKRAEKEKLSNGKSEKPPKKATKNGKPTPTSKSNQSKPKIPKSGTSSLQSTPAPSDTPAAASESKNDDNVADGALDGVATASESVSAAVAPVVKVDTCEMGIQTDDMEPQIEVSTEVKTVVDEMTLRQLERLKLRETELLSQVKKLQQDVTDARDEVEDLNTMTERLSLEVEILREENEAWDDKYEELQIKYETLELDLDEMKDEKNARREEIAQELSMDTEQINEVLSDNEKLRQTMEQLQDSCLKLIEAKNKQLDTVTREAARIPDMERRILGLLEIEKQFRTIDADVKELQMELDLRLDSDRLIETLTSKNLELETAVHHMKERIRYLEDVQFANEELERESEYLVRELEGEVKSYKFRHEQLIREYSLLQTELKNAQQTIFQFKNHIQKLEETKQRMSSMHDRMSLSKKEKEMEKEAIMRENVELIEKLDDLQRELAQNGLIAAQGVSSQVRCILIESHFPRQIAYDSECMDLLATLERYHFKARFARELLDAFYVDGVRLSLSKEKIRQLEGVHEVCPVLLRHGRYVEAIERALTSQYVDKLNEALGRWKPLRQIERHYDNLLQQCQEKKVDAQVTVSQLIACNETYRAFLRNNFATFDIDQTTRPHDKIDKWELNEGLGKLYYNLRLFSLRMRNVRREIVELSDTDSEDNKLLEVTEEPPQEWENKTDEVTNELDESVRPAANERQVLFEILTKIDELQSTVYEIVKNTLQFTIPSRCSFFGSRTNLKKLENDNFTGIEYQRVQNISNVMATVLSQENKLATALESIDATQARFDKIGQINAALEAQSELSDLGIIPSLERLYKETKDIPHTLRRLFAQSQTNDNALATSSSSGRESSPGGSNLLYQEHLLMSKELQILQRRLSFRGRGIRTASTENANEEDEYTDPYDFSAVGTENESLVVQMYKKLPPWFEKSRLVREELEKAAQLREQLETARCEIQARQREIMSQQQQQSATRNEIEIMKLQLKKEKATHRSLLQYEVQSQELSQRCETLESEQKETKRALDKTQLENESLKRECQQQRRALLEYNKQRGHGARHNRANSTRVVGIGLAGVGGVSGAAAAATAHVSPLKRSHTGMINSHYDSRRSMSGVPVMSGMSGLSGMPGMPGMTHLNVTRSVGLSARDLRHSMGSGLRGASLSLGIGNERSLNRAHSIDTDASGMTSYDNDFEFENEFEYESNFVVNTPQNLDAGGGDRRATRLASTSMRGDVSAMKGLPTSSNPSFLASKSASAAQSRDASVSINIKRSLGSANAALDDFDEYDAMGADNGLIMGGMEQFHRMKNELKETKLELYFLRRTMSTLRCHIAELQIKQKWQELKNEIRPLPSFGVVDDSCVREFEHRKRFYALRRQLYRGEAPDVQELNKLNAKYEEEANSDEYGSDSDYEEESENEAKTEGNGSDGKDVAVATGGKGVKRKLGSRGYGSSRSHRGTRRRKSGALALKSRRELHVEEHVDTARQLNELQKEFANVWASPRVVNIMDKSSGGQAIIGRDFALRRINEKLLDIQKNCLETKNTMVHSNVHTEAESGKEMRKYALLGQVQLPVVGSGGMSVGNNKVWMTRSNLKQITQYFSSENI